MIDMNYSHFDSFALVAMHPASCLLLPLRLCTRSCSRCGVKDDLPCLAIRMTRVTSCLLFAPGNPKDSCFFTRVIAESSHQYPLPNGTLVFPGGIAAASFAPTPFDHFYSAEAVAAAAAAAMQGHHHQTSGSGHAPPPPPASYLFYQQPPPPQPPHFAFVPQPHPSHPHAAPPAALPFANYPSPLAPPPAPWTPYLVPSCPSSRSDDLPRGGWRVDLR